MELPRSIVVVGVLSFLAFLVSSIKMAPSLQIRKVKLNWWLFRFLIFKYADR
jgi:hypothetical protein